ncbi:MAG: quinone oxidoreductase [Kofleriaceae bacterium]|nr:quinone oxidoreductase [Kofleriaceae bacterium]
MMRRIRAIQIEKTGGPEVLQSAEISIGDPGPGEVRIRHEACGLNFIDTYHRTGLYPLSLPAVLGVEGAGVVEAVGEGVTHVGVGDRVAYTSKEPGSYAEARVLSATPVVKLPDAIATDAAAAMMLKGLTVQYLLRRTRHGLEPGEYLVWHAAAGGVGLIACQWARALGYRMIATAGSAEKCALAKHHGAEHAINYRTDDVVARVREITGGAGVKAVFDSVGKDTWERSLECLAPFGLMVSFGNASGAVPPFNILQLSAKGSLYVTRPTLHWHLRTVAIAEAMAGELFAMVTSGKLVVPVERRYPLDQAAQAHRDLEARITTGAGILIP